VNVLIFSNEIMHTIPHNQQYPQEPLGDLERLIALPQLVRSPHSPFVFPVFLEIIYSTVRKSGIPFVCWFYELRNCVTILLLLLVPLDFLKENDKRRREHIYFFSNLLCFNIQAQQQSQVTLKVGILLPVSGKQATRANILQMAQEAEKEHFDSLWVFERLLWPLAPQTPYIATADGSLPVEYQNVLDPLEILTYVAANTDKIALGTSIIDMLFHNPVVLARRFATLDVLSEGRAISGLGIGWPKDEYQASNIPFSSRGKRADEFIEVIKKIWTDDVVEFKGKYYNIPASKIGPKPIQKPHIPIYLGGFSPNTYSRIVNYDANGWLGVVGGPIEYLENTMNTIKDMASKASKDPNNFEVILLTYPNIVDSKEEEDATAADESTRFPLTGTIDELVVTFSE
jgi:probable F420-dependent oxidoreductase